MYISVYIYIFVFVYLISTFLQLLQELLFHSKRKGSHPRSYMVNTQRWHPSYVAPPYPNLPAGSQGPKQEGTVPVGFTADPVTSCRREGPLVTDRPCSPQLHGKEREKPGLNPKLPHYRPHKEKETVLKHLRWNPAEHLGLVLRPDHLKSKRISWI